MPPLSSPKRWLFLLAGCLLVLAGCAENEEVRTYTVTKPQPKVRLLAAIIEQGKAQWFFKLVGPVEDVDRHGKAFAEFVKSVRFTGKADDPVTWQVPPAWDKGPKKELRFATYFLGGKGKPPELSISNFDRISPVLDNVNRWCRLDLGRPPIRSEELDRYTTTFTAGPHQGVLVDMTGPGARKSKSGHPPMGGAGGMDLGMGKRRPKPLPLSYDTPPGWTETGPRSKVGITILTTFEIKDAGQSAEVQVTPLGGSTGSLLPNINRWREQVGLNEISQGDLDRDPPRKVRIAGMDGQMLDLSGPQKRQVVAWIKQGELTWFFKLLGAGEVVGKNVTKFGQFLESVKFTGAADE